MKIVIKKITKSLKKLVIKIIFIIKIVKLQYNIMKDIQINYYKCIKISNKENNIIMYVHATSHKIILI